MLFPVFEYQVGSKAFNDLLAAFKFVEQQLATAMEGSSVPLRDDLRKALQLVAKKLMAEHSRPWNAGAGGGDKLMVRSGEGLRSIAESIDVSGSTIDSLSGRISAAKLSVHETGATIRAKSSGYLTIPLPAAMDSRGIPLRKRARDWANTFVTRSKKGNLLIFQKKGRREITPLYILKPEVTLRPRLGMEGVVVNDALPYFERKAFATIEREINRRFG